MNDTPAAGGPSPTGPEGPGRDDADPPLPDFTADRVEEDTAASIVARQDRTGPPFQWPTSIVLVGLVTSLLIVADDHFRRGSVLFAAFVVGAFFLRALLPERDAGWLAVRSRRIDLLCLGVLGGSVTVLAFIVPPPSF